MGAYVMGLDSHINFRASDIQACNDWVGQYEDRIEC